MPHPVGSQATPVRFPGIPIAPAHPTHQPLIEVHSQPAYETYYLRDLH